MAAAPDLLESLRDLLPYARRAIEQLEQQMAGSLYPAINRAILQRAADTIAKAGA